MSPNREIEIIEAIKRGLADVKAGRVVSHEHVVNEARQIIARAKKRRDEPPEDDFS